jgi:rubrerythrin
MEEIRMEKTEVKFGVEKKRGCELEVGDEIILFEAEDVLDDTGVCVPNITCIGRVIKTGEKGLFMKEQYKRVSWHADDNNYASTQDYTEEDFDKIFFVLKYQSKENLLEEFGVGKQIEKKEEKIKPEVKEVEEIVPDELPEIDDEENEGLNVKVVKNFDQVEAQIDKIEKKVKRKVGRPREKRDYAYYKKKGICNYCKKKKARKNKTTCILCGQMKSKQALEWKRKNKKG